MNSQEIKTIRKIIYTVNEQLKKSLNNDYVIKEFDELYNNYGGDNFYFELEQTYNEVVPNINKFFEKVNKNQWDYEHDFK